tara:strand:+ start:6069 stop:7403 length:1335 start_codon:yes stop_codon:yes gene_type:complete
MTKKRYIDSPAYDDAFHKVRPQLAGAGLAALDQARLTALERFMQDGLPGPRVEEWKYCNLTRLADRPYLPIPRETVEAAQLSEDVLKDEPFGGRLVFVNGYFVQNLSRLPQIEGIEVKALSELKNDEKSAGYMNELVEADDGDSLLALNQALFSDGMILRLGAGVELAEPLEILHLADRSAEGKARRSRNLIHLEKGAKATVVEKYAGAAACFYWTQDVSRIVLEEDARLISYSLQQEGEKAVHMARKNVELAAGARYENHSLQLGAELSRTEIFPRLLGEGAKVVLKGAYMGREGQSHDIFTRMDHVSGHCDSEQVFRGVLDTGGKGAFQGRVIVERDAQKTNADQSCKNLLLSRQAEANAKPELLIYADDVKCSHGATVGELDKMALFYLQSRGLSLEEAKALLVQAFIAEIFEEIEETAVREEFIAYAEDWLDQAGQKVTS